MPVSAKTFNMGSLINTFFFKNYHVTKFNLIKLKAFKMASLKDVYFLTTNKNFPNGLMLRVATGAWK